MQKFCQNYNWVWQQYKTRTGKNTENKHIGLHARTQHRTHKLHIQLWMPITLISCYSRPDIFLLVGAGAIARPPPSPAPPSGWTPLVEVIVMWRQRERQEKTGKTIVLGMFLCRTTQRRLTTANCNCRATLTRRRQQTPVAWRPVGLLETTLC